MSAAKRVRLLVAAIAVVVAAAVAGIVLATRQDPAQPTAQCKQRPVPLIVPGVPSAQRGRRSGGVRPQPEDGCADPRADLPAGSQGSGRAVQLRHRALLRRVRRRRRTGLPAGEEGRLRHLLRDARRPDPAPAVLPAGGRALSDLPAAAPERPPGPGRAHAAPRARSIPPRSSTRGPLACSRETTRPRLPQPSAASTKTTSRRSFSRLGPLVKRFPHSQSVRYHLGLLLAWTGQREQAIKEFRLAQALNPSSTLGKQSAAFLNGLTGGGSSTTKK